MSILAWIFVGLVAGALAKLILPGTDPGGCIVTMLVGIAGAIIGGFISTAVFGGPGVSGFDLTSILIATLGAILFLIVYRAVVGRRA